MGKKTVVYTPGVWDLLHVGHLNILNRAKLLGDHLIVGVCADSLVEQTKGRAVVRQEDRAKLLLALEPVDEIHIYDSLDQRKPLRLLNVDVFCVGEEFGCYEEHQAALQFCHERDIPTHVVLRFPGISSTKIRTRILDKTTATPAVALAVDYHDCLTFDPDFFKTLFDIWPGETYILSGTPERHRPQLLDELRQLGLHEGENFGMLLLGFNYDEKNMDLNHFKRMREHKLSKLKQYNIKVFFDDNPFYVDWMREHGITVFQAILPTEYTRTFGEKNPYFSCHLQSKQFHFLSLLDDVEVKKADQ